MPIEIMETAIIDDLGENTMLRLLTKGGAMSRLYIQYLKHRKHCDLDNSALVSLLVSMKSMVAEESAYSDTAVKKLKFKRYQESLARIHNQ
jgi:hypothetical protein